MSVAADIRLKLTEIEEILLELDHHAIDGERGLITPGHALRRIGPHLPFVIRRTRELRRLVEGVLTGSTDG